MLFLTTGVIAKSLGVERDVVSYALRKTGVTPIGRAGGVRIFSPAALTEVRKYLAAKPHRQTLQCRSPSRPYRPCWPSESEQEGRNHEQ